MDRTDNDRPVLVDAAELVGRRRARRLTVRPRTWRPFPGARTVEVDVRVAGWRYLVVRLLVVGIDGRGRRVALEAATGPST